MINKKKSCILSLSGDVADWFDKDVYKQMRTTPILKQCCYDITKWAPTAGLYFSSNEYQLVKNVVVFFFAFLWNYKSEILRRFSA
jgi:hypothetical protein